MQKAITEDAKQATLTGPKTSWRDALRIHPACDALPLMSAEELGELADDIERNGLRHGIDLYCDADGREFVIDGRNRLDAMELLGWDVVTAGGQLVHKYHHETLRHMELESPEIAAWVISTNLRRRNLNQGQKRDLLAKLLKADPSKSNRQVAKAAGRDHKTVATVRAEVESNGEIPHYVERTEESGRKARGRKPKPTERSMVPEEGDDPLEVSEVPLHSRHRHPGKKRRTKSEIELDRVEMAAAFLCGACCALEQLAIPPLIGEFGAELYEELRKARRQLAHFEQRIKAKLVNAPANLTAPL